MKIHEVFKKLGLLLSISLIASAASTGCSSNEVTQTGDVKGTSPAAETTQPVPSVKGKDMTPDEARTELIEGNKRFTSGKAAPKDTSPAALQDLAENGQHPFATVLTCSDSRVSPEIIFDQGLGKVFVVRDAGNVTDSVETGSVEYGVEHLKTPILVVLGHTHCGAVKASVEGGEVTPNIESIVDKIAPSVDSAKSSGKGLEKEKLASLVEDKNIENTIKDLLKSPTIKHLADSGKLKIVAAKYNIETGSVEFTN